MSFLGQHESAGARQRIERRFRQRCQLILAVAIGEEREHEERQPVPGLLVECSEALRLSAWGESRQLGRAHHSALHERDRAVGSESEVSACRRVGVTRHLPVERNRIEVVAAALHHDGNEAARIAAPEELADVVVEIADHGHLAAAPIHQLQLPLIGLEAVARLREPRQPVTIGRRLGRGVVSEVVRGQVARRLPAVHRDRPQIAVRAPRFALRRLGADDHLHAVGRERDVVSASQSPGGPVRVSGSDIARGPALRRLHEHVRALSVLPFRPVPREQVIDDPCLDLACLPLLEALPVTRVDGSGVAAAARVDVARIREPTSVR